MKTKLFNILNWTFGLILLMSGVSALAELEWAGIFGIACGCLLVPPIRDFFNLKFSFFENLKNPRSTRWLSFFIAFILMAVYTPQEEDKLIKFFHKNRVQIIKSMQQSYDEKTYEDIVRNYKKYTVVNDPLVNNLINESEKILQRREKDLNETRLKKETAYKTHEILNELKGIPTKAFQKNKELYEMLVALNPQIEKYQDKVAFYSKKIDERIAKQAPSEFSFDYQIMYEVRNKRYDGGKNYYVLIETIDLNSDNFKTDIKRMIDEIVKSKGGKISIDFINNKETLDLIHNSHYGKNTLGRILTKPEMDKIGMALVAGFAGQLETNFPLNSLSFFPGAFINNVKVGKYVETIEYNPNK